MLRLLCRSRYPAIRVRVAIVTQQIDERNKWDSGPTEPHIAGEHFGYFYEGKTEERRTASAHYKPHRELEVAIIPPSHTL